LTLALWGMIQLANEKNTRFAEQLWVFPPAIAALVMGEEITDKNAEVSFSWVDF